MTVLSEEGLLTRGSQEFQNCHDEATLVFIKRFQTALRTGMNGKRVGKGIHSRCGWACFSRQCWAWCLIITVCLIGYLLKLDLKGSLLWNLVFQCFLGALDRITI